MTKWELTNPTSDQLAFIRGLCGSSITRIDRETVNVTVADEAVDELVEYCEIINVPIRLI